MISPLAYLGFHLANLGRVYDRIDIVRDRRKHHWSKAVQRRRKHRAMTKAMRQNLRRR